MLNSQPRLVPQTIIKDLIIGNQAHTNPAMLQTIKTKFSYDFHHASEFVPVETYVAIINYLRETLHADKKVEDGYFLVGTASLEGHFQGTIGKISKVAARMFSMEKATQFYLKTQRYNYSFGKHILEDLQKGYLRYHRVGVPVPPATTRGVLTYLLKLTGAKNVKVVARTLKPEDAIYEVWWD